MTYSTFAADTLIHGAHFACNHAARVGVSGATMAKWLSRLTLKVRDPARVAAQQVAA